MFLYSIHLQQFAGWLGAIVVTVGDFSFRWIRVTKVVEWGVGLINAQRPVITHLGQNWQEFYLN